jgi:hypothetical protein
LTNASVENAWANLAVSAPASGFLPRKSRARKSTSCGSRSWAYRVSMRLPLESNSKLFQMIGPKYCPWLKTCRARIVS